MSLPSLFSYLPKEEAEQLCKIAEKGKYKEIAKSVGTGLAGTGLGYLAGAGTLALVDKLHQRVKGTRIPSSALSSVVPVLGAGAGLAYSLYKAHEMEAMKRALESDHDEPHRRVP